MIIHKFRIVHDKGFIEFSNESDAVEYRDEHHPNCEIVEIEEELLQQE